jgi:hypothetical protein
MTFAAAARKKGTIMIDLINEECVRRILDDAEKRSEPLSRNDFYALCRRDVHSGYRVEVDEAAHRYFARRLKPVHAKAIQRTKASRLNRL